MREIKFRGKSVDTGEWIYGDLVHNALTAKTMSVPVAIKPDNCYPIEVIPESVGQYINLYDDHKTEIYERDVAIMHSECSKDWKPKEIKWNEEHGMMMLGNTLVIMSKMEAAEMTVIGNACDNSELVNEK